MTSLLSGCWDSEELADLSIVTALGIDKEEDKYKVTVQILNPSELAGDTLTTRSPVNSYTETGDTLMEALRRLTTTVPRRMYFSHLRIIILGEEFARDGIAGILDLLSRDHEMRTDFLFAVVKDDSAKNVLEILTPLEKIPANKLWGMIQTSEEVWSGVASVEIDELISAVTSKGKEASITGLQIIGDPEAGSKLPNVENIVPFTMIGAYHEGAFQDDKFVGWLNENQTRMLNNIANKVKSTVITIPCGEKGNLSLEVLNSNTEKKAKVKGNTPTIDVTITKQTNIADVSCVLDLTDSTEITRLQKKVEKDLGKLMEESVKGIQEMGTDIFGFGEEFKKNHFTYWKTVENNWDDVFSNQLEVNIKLDVQIKGTGTTNQSFFNDIQNPMNQKEE